MNFESLRSVTFLKSLKTEHLSVWSDGPNYCWVKPKFYSQFFKI